MSNELIFGNRIGFFANICYGSKKQFAKVLDITPQHLNSYINAKRMPSFEILKKFFDAGLNLDWLMLGEGNFFSKSVNGKKLRIDKRVEGLIQITFYYLNKEQVTIDEFKEKAISFSCLLGNDDESFNKLKETIENSTPEDFEYPTIKDLTLGYSIYDDVIRAIFDEEFISKNEDFISKIYTPWPLKSEEIPDYFTRELWRSLNYRSISPWSMFGQYNDIYQSSIFLNPNPFIQNNFGIYPYNPHNPLEYYKSPSFDEYLKNKAKYDDEKIEDKQQESKKDLE